MDYGDKLTETAPQGTTTSIYDLAGRRTRVTLPGATTLYANTAYDLLGNVTVIRENGATSGVGVLATYQYDSLSRRSSVTFGNGVVQNTSYDNASRLATQTNDLAATANDLTQTFSYNPASQITSVTRSNDLYAWTGHADQNDGSTPNGLNQITNICPLGGTCKTVTHDGKGNITAVGSDSYGYSSENFLTSGPAGTTLGYDPLGRLYQVTAAATTTSILYDGLDRVAEYNAANNVVRRYVHGPGLDEPIVWYEGGGRTDRHFLSADERGSVIALTDSSGTLLNINTYDEYGVPQSTNLGRFGYTGQVWVPEVGLWYYKARFYRPDIGRFMQTDPIGYEGGPNPYVYVRGDPINLRDPSGTTSCSARYFVTYLEDPNNPGQPIGDPLWWTVHLDGGCTQPPDLGGWFEKGDGEWMTFEDPYEEDNQCPSGGYFNLGPSIGSTGVLGMGGFSGSISVGIAIPNDFFSTGSLRGMQFYGTGSVSQILGPGLYGGYGGGLTGGYSTGPIGNGYSTSSNIMFGAGHGMGAEGSEHINGGEDQGSWSGSLSMTSSLGAYAGVASTDSYTFSSNPIGCN